MRNRPHATWWDIAEELDLMICDGKSAGCRKKWTSWAHHQGKIDSIGVIHWDGWNKQAYTTFLHQILVWAGFAKHREFRNEPIYLGLFHANRWAAKAAVDTFGIRIPYEETIKDRARVARSAKRARVHLKRDHLEAWTWSHWKPKRAKIRTPVTGGA